MKIFLTSILVLAVISGGVLFWLNQAPDRSEPDSPPVLIVEETPETQPGDEPEEPMGLHPAAEEKGGVNQYAKRITAVPGDPNEETQQLGRPFDFEFQESVKKMVESALGGVVEDAVSLGQLFSRCSGTPMNEADILTVLQNKSRNFSTKTRWMMSNGDRRTFKSFEEFESYHWELYDQCRVMHAVAEDDLHERIVQIAQSGHIFARYVFAMWRPQSLGTKVDTENMLDWLVYQDQALEYTLQNVNEGEPLGLLALGQSYQSFQLGLFTPRKMRFDEPYYLAAKKCGLQSAWLDAQIEEFIKRMSDSEQGLANLEQIDASADELKALFCD